jgi:predicted metal-binding membrane protein
MTVATDQTQTERLLKHERSIILASMAAIIALSWLYLLIGAGTGMSTLAMTTWAFPPTPDGLAAGMQWSPGYWTLMLTMWWVMMIAMMVPSAAPMILLYARVHRHGQKRGQIPDTIVPTAMFAGGYLIAWLGFSMLATTLQWYLEIAGLLSQMMMWSNSLYLSAALLIAAGLYQLTPLKHACLEHCRSPASFLSKQWRPGPRGALRMGLSHGTYCLGCCWLLMALLFVGGTMNLAWIAGLTLLVLIEKVVPYGGRFAQGSGLLMAGAGVALLIGS